MPMTLFLEIVKNEEPKVKSKDDHQMISQLMALETSWKQENQLLTITLVIQCIGKTKSYHHLLIISFTLTLLIILH